MMNQEEIDVWLGDVRQEKKNGAMITEHDIDAIIELLEMASREHKAIQRVIEFRDELLQNESTVFAVSHAFAKEIDRALKGHR